MGMIGGVVCPPMAPVALVNSQERAVALAAVANESAVNDVDGQGFSPALEQRCRRIVGSLPGGAIPFRILVSPTQIRVWTRDGCEPAVALPTAATFAGYSRHQHGWQPSPSHLMTLTQAWLADLAWGWGDQPAPGAAQLDRIGLPAALRDAEPQQVHPDEEDDDLRP